MSKHKLLDRYKLLGHEIDPETVDLLPSLRINTLKINEQECKRRLEQKGVSLTEIPHIKSGYYYEADFPIVSSEEYLLGYVYLQETASMVPAIVLLDGETPTSILDMCAAPGSKTTQLAQLTNNKVPIVALDTTLLRLKKLEFNLERLGIASVTTFRKDARFVFDLEQSFSHILLDAPCSGNFCIEEDFFDIRSPREFKERARLQKSLLQSAYSVLVPGGVLVYATCSLEPEEDEMLVDWMLNTYEDVSLEPILLEVGESGATKVFDTELSSEVAKTKKFWPEKTKTQGFFVARFRKKEN